MYNYTVSFSIQLGKKNHLAGWFNHAKKVPRFSFISQCHWLSNTRRMTIVRMKYFFFRMHAAVSSSNTVYKHKNEDIKTWSEIIAVTRNYLTPWDDTFPIRLLFRNHWWRIFFGCDSVSNGCVSNQDFFSYARLIPRVIVN